MADRIVHSLERDIYDSGHTLASHLRRATHELRKVALEHNVRPVSITGRNKSARRSVEKLLDTPDNTIGALNGPLAGMDRIGLRLVVRTDSELDRLLSALLPKALYLKDFVAQPRRDGEYLGGDPSDVYRGYHLFTRQLTGIPVEIQMFTAEQRQAGIRLKRKYGNGYWKLKRFRRRRIMAGDFR